jgi:hypothetical protein
MDALTAEKSRQEVFDYIKAMLGDGMVEVELDPIHYDTALNKALARFRQRSSGAVEEAYYFLELKVDQNDYVLPKEVIEVRSLYRRTIGSRTGMGGGGTLFEPFNLAYTNTYLLNSTQLGGIATYDMFAQYQEMIGRMFGAYIEFQWIAHSHTLRILQRPFAEGEMILIRGYNYKPDWVIIGDVYSGQWIKDYALATAKIILGEARGKFANIAGPGGAGGLNGADLKSSGKEELAALDKELQEHIPAGSGGTGYTLVIG